MTNTCAISLLIRNTLKSVQSLDVLTGTETIFSNVRSLTDTFFYRTKHGDFALLFFLFTSMFVERMEVLEYRQKFEVELSTFPDSTNTETPRKLVFSLTCVCVCLSVYMSVRKSLSVDILRKS